MKQFQIQVADRVIHIEHQYDALADCCRDYVTDERNSDMAITITEEDISFEKLRSEQNARAEGRDICAFEEPMYEISAANRLVSRELLSFDTLLMHGTAVAVDDVAYIFTAKSGTGKSTHAALWQELLGDRATIVNDDKPFLRLTQEDVYVYGSPWCGKEGKNTNCRVSLQAICILQQASDNRLREISFEEAMPALMGQIFRPQEQTLLQRTMELIARLQGRVRFYRLECRPDMEAARLSYEAMSKKSAGECL